jgi:alanyl-tRNA synthetase
VTTTAFFEKCAVSRRGLRSGFLHGGGKPILAQAGGKDVAKLADALAAAAAWAKDRVV